MSNIPTALDPIGPLQLKVMHYLWKVNSSTVQEVMDVLNAQIGTGKPLAYTTYLTVMRNLRRRGLLDQRKTETKKNQFVTLVDEQTYKSHVLRQMLVDYCNNDPARLHHFLGESAPITSASPTPAVAA